MAGITTQENFYKVEQNNLLSEENPGEAKLLLLVSLKKKKKKLSEVYLGLKLAFIKYFDNFRK